MQQNAKDEENLAKTKCAISELEMKLGVCVDEVLSDEDDEPFQNDCEMENSEELFKAEMQYSEEGALDLNTYNSVVYC